MLEFSSLRTIHPLDQSKPLHRFLRLDKSGFEQFSLADCPLKIPVQPMDSSARDYYYLCLADGRWVVSKWIEIPLGIDSHVFTGLFDVYEQLFEVNKSDVIKDLDRAGLPIPPELRTGRKPAKTKPGSRGTTPDTTANLPDRLELILDVFREHGPGPHRGKQVANLARLDYNSDLRSDLSQLKRLEYLVNDGAGYERTEKPYPCQ